MINSNKSQAGYSRLRPPTCTQFSLGRCPPKRRQSTVEGPAGGFPFEGLWIGRGLSFWQAPCTVDSTEKRIKGERGCVAKGRPNSVHPLACLRPHDTPRHTSSESDPPQTKPADSYRSPAARLSPTFVYSVKFCLDSGGGGCSGAMRLTSIHLDKSLLHDTWKSTGKTIFPLAASND